MILGVGQCAHRVTASEIIPFEPDPDNTGVEKKQYEKNPFFGCDRDAVGIG